ncbi:MAG: hypothetical protein ACXAB4_03260 [Candidatus Hodarchaeales archaeon]
METIKRASGGRPSLKPTKKELLDALHQSTSIEDVARKFNISKRSAYRYIKNYKINPRNFGIPYRNPPTPDTPKLREKITTTYLQEHSIIGVHRKLKLKRERISQTLKELGFAIHDPTHSNMLHNHFKGVHSVPLSEKLATMITGELLGDGNISCNTDSEDKEFNCSSKDYKTIVGTPPRLAKALASNTLTVSEAIEKYNLAAAKLVGAQIAHFRFHKSPLEEPWIRYVAKQFKKDGYSVNFILTNRSIHMTTQGTIQLYREYQRWYPKGKKLIPRELELSPEIVLHWYVGDGSASKYHLDFNTQSFKKLGSEFLAKLLKKEIGINGHINSYVASDNKKTYHKILLYSHKESKKFFEYIEGASSDALTLAKQLLPWKFDRYLRKKDVYDRKRKFVNTNYLETYLDLLEKSGIEISARTNQLHYLFPWKFPSTRT